ncbi:MAG TPA: APC family permease [Bryobacteraceae bacterium]|nr:APC family permease [Bryobacteraceae bacterium]
MEKSGQKKMNLFTITALAVGAIIGAGIFGTMPSAVSVAGTNVVWCILGAAVTVSITALPGVIPGSAIPCPSGYYMFSTRLVHPYLAGLEILGVLTGTFLLALLGRVFASYFSMIIPMNQTVCAVASLAVFFVINLFGVQAGAKAQNVMVIFLMAALLAYILFGFGYDTAGLPGYQPMETKPMTLITFGTVTALFVTCLSGGQAAMDVADQVENPRRNVLLSFILSTLLVMVIYMLMGVATVRVAGNAAFDSLAVIAKLSMPGAFYLFFLIGGALCALATTINAMLLQGSYKVGIFAEDQILPKAFNKTNRHGQRPLCVLANFGVSIGILCFGLPISTLLSISSCLIIFLTLLRLIPVLVLPGRYPHSYAHAMFHPSRSVLYMITAAAAVIGGWQIYSTVTTTAAEIWYILLALVAVFYGYLILRGAYLKKQGVDLVKILRTPYPDWEINEELFRAQAEAAGMAETPAPSGGC